MSEVETDHCLECGVEVSAGGSWGYCVPCANTAWGKLVGGKCKPLNRTPNPAAGEIYKDGTLYNKDGTLLKGFLPEEQD